MKLSKQLLSTAILIIMAMTTTFSQTTRYVATTGTNTGNDCTDSSNPCATIVHALNEASPNDIVELAAGAYTQSQSGGLLIQKSITIQGADRETTFIQAHSQPNQAGHRTITIAPLPIDVEINSLTIRNGVALGSGIPGRGGGIYYDFDTNNPGTLSIYDVKFQQNTARVGGGVFSSAGSAPVIEFVHFQANSATERGGGMYNWTDSEPEIIGVVFQSNSAGISGGGIYNTAVNLILDQSTFMGNFASFGCGAVVLQNNSMATVTTTTFINNTTSGNGGGLCMDGNSVAGFIDTNFTDNEALGGQGGAVHIVNGSSPTFTNVSFLSNQVSGNATENGGGAVFISTNSEPVFEDVVFDSNTAQHNGGAVLCYNSNPQYTNVQFISNTGGPWGGALANMDGSSPVMNNVLFEDNFSAGLGGGMANINGSSPTMSEIQFIENTGGAGGGMGNYGNSNPQMSNVFFIGNTGHEGGGGMYNLNNSHPEITNAVFAENISVDPNLGHGAGIYNENSSPYILNSTFSKNQAMGVNTAGGGLANYGTSAPVVFNTIFWDNIAASGNEVFNDNTASASLHYSLYPDESGDIVAGAGFTCSNCLTENPLFSNPGSNHFQLTENSPAVNAGDPNTATMSFPIDGNGGSIDILGNPRFFGSTIDIGAYEWNDNLSIGSIAGNPLHVLIYPNPAADVLHIESKQVIERAMMYDLLGKVLYPHPRPLPEGEGRIATLDVSGLARGVYVLKVQAGGQEGVYRIIKK